MQVQEIGTLETPIALTNTLNVGKVADAMISWMIQQTRKEGEDVFSINPVVGECNDSRINEICNRVVGEKELYQALEQADTDFVEGDIGAGTGTICYGLKGESDRHPVRWCWMEKHIPLVFWYSQISGQPEI